MLQPNARGSANAFLAARNSRPGSNFRSQPTGGPSASFGANLSSRELIARQKALVQDIREVIWLTQTIIDTTREQLDRLDSLSGARGAFAEQGKP
jgi:hypothetical protein